MLFDGLDYDSANAFGGMKDLHLINIFLLLSIINLLSITLQKGISVVTTSLIK
jgi:hypothetical protein